MTDDVLAVEPPCSTLSEVIARMQSISATLPANDGVGAFNRMYLEVTQSVEQNLQQGTFADSDYVSQLDVVFANRYFAAVDALSGPSSALPTAWRPLMDARTKPGIEPMQFALAGMNAHINYDLPLAVVSTCAQLGSAPTDGSHHADYQRIDSLLDAAEQSVRESFEPPDVRDLDRHVAAVADLIANWSINEARDVAWDTALALWAIRHDELATRLVVDALAGTVAMASRVLLVAV